MATLKSFVTCVFIWISWKSFFASGLSGCESKVAETDLVGLLFSQENFDDGISTYANDYFKCWQVTTSDGIHIVIEAVEFNLQPVDGNGNCLDYVKIYNGNTNDTSDLVGTYCGTAFNTYTTTGTDAVIIFSTDSSTVARGFELKYQSETEESSANVAQIVGFTVLAVGVVALGVAIMIFCVTAHHNKQRHVHVEHNHPEDDHHHHGDGDHHHHHHHHGNGSDDHKEQHRHHFKKTGEA